MHMLCIYISPAPQKRHRCSQGTSTGTHTNVVPFGQKTIAPEKNSPYKLYFQAPINFLAETIRMLLTTSAQTHRAKLDLPKNKKTARVNSSNWLESNGMVINSSKVISRFGQNKKAKGYGALRDAHTDNLHIATRAFQAKLSDTTNNKCYITAAAR